MPNPDPRWQALLTKAEAKRVAIHVLRSLGKTVFDISAGEISHIANQIMEQFPEIKARALDKHSFENHVADNIKL